MKTITTILAILIFASVSGAQVNWLFAGISDDGSLRVDYNEQYSYYRGGDVEVWIRGSEPYFGRWRTTFKALIRFDCVTYATYMREAITPDGFHVRINKSGGRAPSTSLLRIIAVDLCNDNSR